MGENKINFNAFNSASLQDWEVAARAELGGADPWQKLGHRDNGLSILPFYEKSDVKESLILPVSQNKFLGPRTWYNCPAVNVENVKNANKQALEYLSNGAEGIYFELAEVVDFEILLKGIEWQYISLNFLAKKNPAAHSTGLSRFIQQEKDRPGHTHGALFSDSPSFQAANANFRFAGIQVNPFSPPVEGLVLAFSSLIGNSKEDFRSKLQQVAFSVAIGNDFMLEICRLRAMRNVWSRIVSHYHAPVTPLLIHALSTPLQEPKYEPHENMLKGTTSAMSAILGGCDALTIVPEDANHLMMGRVARNISNILREESHFSKVADPVAGSYFIENLTEQLTESVWMSIQTYLRK